MDWFLYDNGLRHERVKDARAVVCNAGWAHPVQDTINNKSLTINSFRMMHKITIHFGKKFTDSNW